MRAAPSPSPSGPASGRPAALHRFAGSGAATVLAAHHAPVLIVEDYESCALTLACSLEFLGYPCHTALSAESALVILERFHHVLHCVILDLELPHTSGAELCRLIARRWPSLRIILCTGHYETDVRQLYPLLSWVAFLHKPFPFRDLQAALAALPQRLPSASSSFYPTN